MLLLYQTKNRNHTKDLYSNKGRQLLYTNIINAYTACADLQLFVEKLYILKTSNYCL